jgi:DNA-binding response OmpR family regulator
MKIKVLYIEDEVHLGRIVKETMEKEGLEVIWETDGAKVMEHFLSFSPDICVLDIMLPHVDGFEICEQIRNKFPQLPIIFLTAKINTNDVVKGFEAGGNDYMRKPFSIEELIVRIHNQLKFKGENPIAKPDLTEKTVIGKYTFFANKYELLTPTQTIRLSQRDLEVLSQLIRNKNHITDRKELLLKVWGDDSFFNSRNLDVYIRKIRDYFREDSNIKIKTLKGKGYLFLVE